MTEMKRKPVYTASEVAAQLRESDSDKFYRNVWQAQEVGTAVQAGGAREVNRQSYLDATAAAYDSYLKNKMQIESSELLGSSQQTLLAEQQNALESAYNSYYNSYTQNEENIAENYLKQLESIDTALITQGTNTANYLNLFGDYYTSLTENYGEALINDELWNTRFGIDVDEDGQSVHRLATWDELRDKMYDENRELTRFGEDVIDQLENAQIGKIINDELVPSWEDFLYNENEELYDWAFNTYNPYNWTEAGVNVGSIKAMTGRLSTDNEYTFLERWGGLTEEQTDKIFSKFNDAMNEFKSIGQEKKRNKGKAIVGDVANAMSELNSFASQLGIDQELDQAFMDAGLPGGFKALQDDLQKFKSGTLSEGQMAARWFGGFAASGMAGGTVGAGIAIAGTSTASAIATGSALLGATAASGPAAPIVAAVIAIGMIAVGITKTSAATHEQRKQNERMANQAIELYQQAVNTTLAYAKGQARTAENKYMKS